jgi:hypothetical protein
VAAASRGDVWAVGSYAPTVFAELQTLTYTDPGGQVNSPLAGNAITTAEGAGYRVDSKYLGVAVHPHKYNINEYDGGTGYWRNYFGAGNTYNTNGCFDLGTMINLWSSAIFAGLPLAFTEDNWVDRACVQGTNCGSTCTQDTTTCEGTYLVDLFTWLSDHGYTNPASPLRVMWFTSFDFTADDGFHPLGLYGGAPPAGDKAFSVPIPPSNKCLDNAQVQGFQSLANGYTQLVLPAQGSHDYCYRP